MDALRAHPAGSPVGSHSTYKQLRCLLHGAVLTRGANNMINELLTQDTSWKEVDYTVLCGRIGTTKSCSHQ